MSPDLQVQTSGLQGFIPCVLELGGDPYRLLAELDLSPALLEQVDGRISIATFCALLNTAANALNRADFGLLLGSRQDFSALGALGMLMQHCRSVGEALNAAISSMRYHNQSEFWHQQTINELTLLRRIDLFHDHPASRQYTELSFAVCLRFFKLVLGEPLHGCVLQLSHAPISELGVYQKHLGVEVRFNQEHDVITFPSHLLKQTLKQRSDASLTAAQRRVSGQLNGNNVPLLERLNLLIKLTLGGSSISIIPVAQLLGMHPRTLQRRLAEQGVNYRELVLSIRMQQASWYLQFSDIDITLLGHALGYQDGANFTRAFKRFFGCSPRQWRHEKRGDSAPRLAG